MPSYFVFAAAGLLIAYVANTIRSLYINIAAAKRSGIPYIICPVYAFNGFWLLTHPIWLYLIERVLPKRWQGDWLE